GDHDAVAILYPFDAFDLLGDAGIYSAQRIYIAGNIVNDPNRIGRRIGICYQSAHQSRQEPQGAQLLSNQKYADNDADDNAYAFGLIVPHKLKSGTHHGLLDFDFTLHPCIDQQGLLRGEGRLKQPDPAVAHFSRLFIEQRLVVQNGGEISYLACGYDLPAAHIVDLKALACLYQAGKAFINLPMEYQP